VGVLGLGAVGMGVVLQLMKMLLQLLQQKKVLLQLRATEWGRMGEGQM